MDRDELINRMAAAIFRLRCADRNVKSSDLARAALAVAEPVIREWCIEDIDNAEPSDEPWLQIADIKRAIRTGGTP